MAADNRSGADQGDAYKVQVTDETNGGHSPDVNQDDTALNDFDPNRVDEDDEDDPGADLDGRVLEATAQRGVGPMTTRDAEEGDAGTIGYGEKTPAGPGGLLGGR
jgi:hypothetical protein